MGEHVLMSEADVEHEFAIVRQTLYELYTVMPPQVWKRLADCRMDSYNKRHEELSEDDEPFRMYVETWRPWEWMERELGILTERLTNPNTALTEDGRLLLKMRIFRRQLLFKQASESVQDVCRQVKDLRCHREISAHDNIAAACREFDERQDSTAEAVVKVLQGLWNMVFEQDICSSGSEEDDEDDFSDREEQYFDDLVDGQGYVWCFEGGAGKSFVQKWSKEKVGGSI
ncbi:hypothetical protein M011DRAFT_486865 [Sporormia fimetaria CBS 119925]|uniref:Uncharacterized protein n=1 Tax=Sporormia fimetaria CBS 119925 TaxID=1340428 RepID=A0A6A6VAR6_9PLEO|nr:hypothetical protein M011DRAFT_486865 [Sporormia fimetaria CBS 119925]